MSVVRDADGWETDVMRCRFYCRQVIIKNLGSDDWIMLAAVVCMDSYRGIYCIIRTAADLGCANRYILGEWVRQLLQLELVRC